MANKYLVNLDLNKNQLLNAVVQNLGTDPATGVKGQIIFNTTDNTFKYHNGTKWVKLDVDLATVTQKLNELTLAPSKITWSTADQAVANNMILAINKGSGKIDKERINGLAEAIQSASMTGEAIVDAVNGQTTKQIQAAKVAGIDTIAQTKADQALRDAKAYADQVKANLLNSASTDYDTFKEIEDAIKRNASSISLLQNVTKKFSQEIGDGVALEHTITHNLNTQDVVVQLRTVASPYEVVLADIEITNANSIKVKTATAIPSTAKIKVTVIG